MDSQIINEHIVNETRFQYRRSPRSLDAGEHGAVVRCRRILQQPAETGQLERSFRSPGTAEHHHHVGGRACHQVRDLAARQSRRHHIERRIQRQLQLSLAGRLRGHAERPGREPDRLRRLPRLPGRPACTPNKLSYTTGKESVSGQRLRRRGLLSGRLEGQSIPDAFRRIALGGAEPRSGPQRLGARVLLSRMRWTGTRRARCQRPCCAAATASSTTASGSAA